MDEGSLFITPTVKQAPGSSTTSPAEFRLLTEKPPSKSSPGPSRN